MAAAKEKLGSQWKAQHEILLVACVSHLRYWKERLTSQIPCPTAADFYNQAIYLCHWKAGAEMRSSVTFSLVTVIMGHTEEQKEEGRSSDTCYSVDSTWLC